MALLLRQARASRLIRRGMPERVLEDGGPCVVAEDFRLPTRMAHMPLDVLRGFVSGEPLKTVLDADPVQQRQMDRGVEPFAQRRMADQQQNHGVLGVQPEIGTEAQVLKKVVWQQMGIVDHKQRLLPLFVPGAGDAVA